jgi:hypothetical protein
MIVAYFIGVFGALLTNGIPAPPDAEALFRGSLEASGGKEVLTRHKSRYVRGRIEIPSQRITGTFEEWRRDNMTRSIAVLSGVGKFEDGFDGTIAWKVNPLEKVVVRTDPSDLRNVRRMADDQIELNYRKHFKKFGATEIGKLDDGREIYRLECVPSEGSASYAIFDMKSGLLIGWEFEDRSGPEPAWAKVIGSNPQRIDGQLGTMKQISEIGGLKVLVLIEEVRFNPDKMPSFEPPEIVREKVRPRTISGIVQKNGRSLPGVEVLLSIDAEERSTRTDSTGKFRFEKVFAKANHYAVSAAHDLALARASGRMPDSGDVEGISLALAEGGAISGQVVDEKGKPLAGASLSMHSGCIYHGRRTADEKGSFNVVLNPGRYEINVSAPDHRSETLTVEIVAGKRSPQVARLSRASAASGRVVGENEQPLAGIELALEREGTLRGRKEQLTIAQTKSGPDGRFSFDGAEPGPHRIVTRKRGAQAPLELMLPSDAIVVQVRGSATVRGRVIAASGAPLTVGAVALVPSTGAELGGEVETRLDGSGQFAFSDVPEGNYELTSYDSEMRQVHKQLKVDKGREHVVELHYAKGLEIRGRVLDDTGHAIAAVPLEATPELTRSTDAKNYFVATAMSDGEGRFSFQNLPAGRYEIRVRPEPESGRLAFAGAQAPAGETDVRIVIASTLEIEGRVIGADGNPVPAFEINQERSQDAGGRFRRTLSAKTQAIEVRAAGFAPRLLSLAGRGKQVRLGDIVLERGRTIRVRVGDAVTGNAVEGARVDAGQPIRFDRLETSSPTVDDDGSFVIEHVPSNAPARITASALGYLDQEVTVQATQTEVYIGLDPGATISGRVLDRDGRPISGVAVEITASEMRSLSGETDPEGRYSISGVPAGKRRVYVSSMLRAAKRLFAGSQVDVPKRGKVTVDIRERAGLDVRVALVDHSGAPVSGASVSLLPRGTQLPDEKMALQHLLSSGLTADRPISMSSEIDIPQVPPGKYTAIIRIISMGAGILIHSTDVEVSSDRPSEIKIQLPKEMRSVPLFDR